MMNDKCISEEDLIDFIEGRLTKNIRAKVEKHLADCDNCLEMVLVAREMSQDSALLDQAEYDAVPENVTKKALESISAIREDSFLNRFFESASMQLSELSNKLSNGISRAVEWHTPEMAVVRGEKEAYRDDRIIIRKTFAEVEIEIEVEKKNEEMVSIKVILTKETAPEKTIRTTLCQNEREISSYLIKRSPAIFDDLPFGHYVLVFTQNGHEVGEYPFEIKGKDF